MEKTAADRIRERREELGMTQEQLADLMGYKGKSSISKIESAGGKVTLKTVEKAAKALNCSTSYLMGWSDSPIPILEKPDEQIIPSLLFDETAKKYSPEEVEKAMRLYRRYQESIPQIQEAVESLLRSRQSDS